MERGRTRHSALGTRHSALGTRHSALGTRMEDNMSDSAMMPASEVRSFRDLLAWQVAMDLCVEVHRATRPLPAFERFELGRQIRRSGVSIPSNVAGGFNRHSQPARSLE